MITRFEEVSSWATKSGQCKYCHKSCQRSRTFTNTINPFNKTPSGIVKGFKEVKDDVERLAEDWLKEQIYHERCFKEAKEN
jgi:hypothetical protein